MGKGKSGKAEGTGTERKKRFLSRKWIIAASLLVTVALVLVLLPYAMELGAERFLAARGARSAQIMNVDFNPFLGRLAVFGLEVAGPEEGGIKLEKFETRLNLWSLFKKRMNVVRAEMVGLEADIRRGEDGSLFVAGFPAGPNGRRAQPEETAVEKEPWGFGIGTVILGGIRLRMVTPRFDDTFLIRHLQMERFATWTPDNPGYFDLRVLLGESSLEVSGTAKPFAGEKALDLRFAVGEFPLSRLEPFLPEKTMASLSGLLGIEGEVSLLTGSRSLEKAAEGPRARSVKGNVSLTLEEGNVGLVVSDSPVRMGQKKLFARMEGAYTDTGTFSPEHLQARSGLTLEGFSLSRGTEPQPLVSIGEASVADFLVEGSENITAQNVAVQDISLLSRRPDSVREGEPGNVASLKNLTLRGITFRETSSLHLEEITLDSLSAWILRQEGGSFEAVDLLPEGMGEEGPATGEKESAESEKKGGINEISLGRLALSGENSLTFRDLDAKPPVTMKLDSISMEVTDFQSGPTGGKAALSLQAGMGKYTSLGVQGKVLAPWDKPDLDARVVLKSLDLPQLTPYTNRYVGYVLNSGHLDMDMDIKISKGALDTETEVKVNRIEMNPVREEDRQLAEKRLGIPVKTALALLKDKNDNIELSLPVKGNLNDPEFRVSDVVLTVTGNALKKGVNTYYKSLGVTLLTGGLLPPGTFTVLGQVFKGAATVSFDPVVFDPLEAELSAKHEEFLIQMAASLSEKPDARLMIIGKVTRRDIMALRQQEPAYSGASPEGSPTGEAGEQPAAGSQDVTGPAPPETDPQVPLVPPSVEEVPLSETEKEQLIDLAKRRAGGVKDFLVETGGLDPSRLFILYSEVEKEEGGPPPRVELSI